MPTTWPPPDGGALPDLLEHLPVLLEGFAAFDNTELHTAIGDVLARLGQVAGVDRTYLFRTRVLADGTEVVDNTHEWCAPGIEPHLDELQALPIGVIEHWLEPFRAGREVYLPRVAALSEDRPEREILTAQGIRSLLAMPLIAAGALVGFVGFDAVHAERGFSAGERLLLRAVTDAIGSAQLRQQALEELSTRERRYRLLARHSADLVVTLDPVDGRFREVSPSAARLLGWDPKQLAATDPGEHLHPEDLTPLNAAMAAAQAGSGGEVRLPDYRLRHRDGSWRWLQATAIDLRHEPSVGGLVIIGHDITERKTAEARLAYQALHDPLTGLANRALLLDRIGNALERAQRHEGTVAVVFLDLDRFKVINDSLGHARGDDLLRAYAQRLAAALRGGDTVARFGGDEFVVVLDEVADAAEAWATTQRLLAALEVPFELGGEQHRVTTSAGVVLADEHSEPHVLLKDADTAMYQAKAGGRQRIVSLDAAQRVQLVEEAELARQLPGITQREELEIEYQPIFSLGDGGCVGYEALARWEHPTLGRVAPGRFIPLAEEHGSIAMIGRAVLARALEQLAAWDRDVVGHDQRFMTVNLSVRQLVHDRLVLEVREAIAAAGVAPSRLHLELTESTLMAEPGASRRVLGELRELGVRIAIDDFGTGYSSLASLRELPVDTLKIDRSFVTGLGSDPRHARVIAVILGLAREFGLRSVAEGIETELQHRELTRLGCQAGQGFGLARPAPPAVLEAQTFMPIARNSSRT